MSEVVDIAVVGGGAAGLMAAIWAGRSSESAQATPPRPSPEGEGVPRIVVLDGAKKLGAKILVAGGGRCNVTHFEVDERQYAGSSGPAIRKVLLQFDVGRTVEFFREIGVELKREETGKLFPTSDDAHTVLTALLGAAHEAGVEIWESWRVGGVQREGECFVIERAEGVDGSTNPPPPSPKGDGALHAKRVVVATGGKSLPRSGSDGFGYEIVKALGHTITPRVFPALVPLTLPKGHFLCQLSGLTVPATIELRSGTGKRLKSFTNSFLCTHFGVSGPGVLDMSRYYGAAKVEDSGAQLVVNWTAGATTEELDGMLTRAAGVSVARWLTENTLIRTEVPEHTTRGMPDRLARALCVQAEVDPSIPVNTLTRERRRALARVLTEMPLPVTGDRGFTFSEVTAGGVPLNELDLKTMESRVCRGLHLCGEILDVDGRIGGFNFQWAWASGFVAGSGAAGLLGKDG